jgi:hypothetical protein
MSIICLDNIDSSQIGSEISNGFIGIDTDFAKKLGFISDKFSTDSYLWKQDDNIIISLIFSTKQFQGYFKSLVQTIESLGYRVQVPYPVNTMQKILTKWGFSCKHKDECDEIWEK